MSIGWNVVFCFFWWWFGSGLMKFNVFNCVVFVFFRLLKVGYNIWFGCFGIEMVWMYGWDLVLSVKNKLCWFEVMWS